MTHDRCSELLGSYVRGELPPEDARAIAAHLEACGECRAEERAVAALATGPEVDALTDVERARLHRGVAQELFKPRANADVAGVAPAAQRWTRWVAPAMAAAAVLAAIVVMTTGGGSDQAAESFGASVEAEDRTVDEDSSSLESQAGGGGGGAAQGGDSSAKSKPLRAAAGQESLDTTGGNATPDFYANYGELSRSTLVDLGNFRFFAGSYSPQDGPGLYEPFLDRIKRKAAEVMPEIDECAATLPQDGSLIPVYGVVGKYDDRDALALGFVTNDPGSEKLDRYLIWVWAREECGQPIDTFFERIDAP